MTKQKKITITFESDWQYNRVLEIINALKDFNMATHEKADIDYGVIRKLDCADNLLGKLFGYEQPKQENGYPCYWSDYQPIQKTKK